jgi:hypothetical protein
MNVNQLDPRKPVCSSSTCSTFTIGEHRRPETQKPMVDNAVRLIDAGGRRRSRFFMPWPITGRTARFAA